MQNEGHEEETYFSKNSKMTQTVELIKHYELGIAKLTHTSLRGVSLHKDKIACEFYLRVKTKEITI